MRNRVNKIIKLYYFHTLKAVWDGQGKIQMYYGMYRVKKQLSGKGLFGYSSTENMFILISDCVLGQKQPPEVFYKKAALKNFAKFIGQYLCWSYRQQLYQKETLTQVFPVNILRFLTIPILKNICERLLL